MSDETIRELFAAFGPVSIRRMFGGAGIFAQGTMFALLADEVIYLKADDIAIPEFKRENQEPFSYATRQGRRSLNSYWRVPDRLYDDPEELSRWARRSLEAAQRSSGLRRRAKATARGGLSVARLRRRSRK